MGAGKRILQLKSAHWVVEILIIPVSGRFFWHAESEQNCGLPYLETNSDYAESNSATRAWKEFASMNNITKFTIDKSKLQTATTSIH